MGQKEHDNEDKNGSKSGGERCLCAALFIHERLRCASAHGKAATESSEEVRRRQCEIFLVGIEPSAVLGGEHAANRGGFDRAEKKASKGQRQYLVQVVPENSR